MAHRALAAVALLLLLCPRAQCRVCMVYSLQRHGARNVLPKSATLQESAAIGGPTLLPEGQRQGFNSGTAYAARYLNTSSCSANGTCLGTPAFGGSAPANSSAMYGLLGAQDVDYNNYNLLVRSSSLDRTVMTALSFLAGAFSAPTNATATRFLPDGQQVIPVYNKPDAEDALIRAYTKCPAYDARLLDWLASDEFKDKANVSAPVRNEVQALLPSADTSLQAWWNVYDSFNVWRTYGVGDPMPDIEDALFTKIQDLANWLETAKMRSELIDNLLGGPLLADLLGYLQTAAAAVTADAKVYYKLVHLSGHYNTQLGVLGALQLDDSPAKDSIPWLKKIPALAALMAFELHTDAPSAAPQFAVRLVAQNGPAAGYDTIPLPCARAGDAAESLAGLGTCTLDAFMGFVQPFALSNSDWCDACQNNSTQACQLQSTSTALEAATQAPSSAADTGSDSSGGGGVSAGAAAGIGVGCAVAGAALVAAVALLLARRHHQKELVMRSVRAQQEVGGAL